MVPTVELSSKIRPKRGRPTGVKETKPRQKPNEKALKALRAAQHAKQVHAELRQLRIDQNKLIAPKERQRLLDQQLPLQVQQQLERFEGDQGRAKLALKQIRQAESAEQRQVLAADAATQRDTLATSSETQRAAIARSTKDLHKGLAKAAAKQREEAADLAKDSQKYLGVIAHQTKPKPAPGIPAPAPVPFPALGTPKPSKTPGTPATPATPPPFGTPSAPPSFGLATSGSVTGKKYGATAKKRIAALGDANVSLARSVHPNVIAYILEPNAYAAAGSAEIQALDKLLFGAISKNKKQFSKQVQAALIQTPQGGSGLSIQSSTGKSILQMAMDLADAGKGGLALQAVVGARGLVPQEMFIKAYKYVMETHQDT